LRRRFNQWPPAWARLRFQQDQGLAAVLDQLAEHFLDLGRIGIGMHLGADQAEAVGQARAAQNHQTTAGQRFFRVGPSRSTFLKSCPAAGWT
jgi:hypothetical protein